MTTTLADDKTLPTLTETSVKELLAEQIGVDTEDLKDEDAFIEDLHMTNADLTDFGQKLEARGANISELDFSALETVGELTEMLGF